MSILEGRWEHGWVNNNKVKLHYVTSGVGPLMLFLHGFPDYWYSWRHQIDEFSKDFKVVALDLRGYNNSEKPKEISAYVMSEFVSDIEGVIKGLGYEKCILVGHDWGGAIAWNFAYERPAMLERLVIMNIAHPAKFSQGLRTPQQILRSWYIFFFQLPILPEWLLQLNDYWAIAQIFTAQVIDKNSFTQADVEAYKDAAARRGALTSMLNYYRNIFKQGVLSREWGVLEIPTLMIWGENDLTMGKELTFDMEAYVRPFQIRYVPDCSHWVQHEKPYLVNQYMRNFLVS